jgi:hypothetical protein
MQPVQSSSTRVHRLRARLGAIPGWVFGGAYLACIPLFAVWYCLIPHGFYQSNIKFEKAYTNEAMTIEKEVCRSLETRISSESNNTQEPIRIEAAGHDWSFQPHDDMVCRRLRISDDDSIAFTLSVTLHRQQKCPPVLVSESCFDIYPINFRVTLDPFDIKIGGTELVSFQPPLGEFAHRLSFVVPSLEGLQGLPEKEEMEGTLAKRLFGENPPVLWIREDLNSKIDRFLQAASGFTSDADDNGIRMLYFSAVTITTIGYGDIVPITGRARGLVTFEAFIGAVLIGLFLQSLAPNKDAKPGMPK